ncbi:hypothetical protein NM09_18635 [Vibrio caribbeanicus]|uniref:Uncharacterized protein n=1 Tax=Vibrio caribbeanicus TaxID=701175 RepID=A0ACC4NSM0_9VIBR|nr:hypothetical protein [Vibrio caribbeanicus]KHD23486.1 hypothetical protein NM09_18635 [Vibrio caribbeanicus]
MNFSKKKNKLVIDFSNGKSIDEFKHDRNVIIVTDADSLNTYNVKDADDVNEELISKFIDSWLSLSDSNVFDRKASISYVYRNVIRPLSKWVSKIDCILDEYDIDEVVFTKICHSKKVFLYEAEGEVNRKWLYSSEYYISSIVKSYIERKIPDAKITYRAVTSKVKVIMSYWFRNISFVGYVFCMNFFRRALRLKSSKTILCDESAEIAVSTRSIVQSDFARRMIKSDEYGKVKIFSSEQASSLVVNSKFLESQSIPFDMASSCSIYTSMIVLVKTLISIIKVANSNIEPICLNNGGLEIDAKSIITDYLFRSYEFEIYSFSLREAVNKNKAITKIVSFDMFTPHAFYLVKNIGCEVCQVQTTLIQPMIECDFVAGSKFYFTDYTAYSDFLMVNSYLKDKLFLIDGLKYRQVSEVKNESKNLKSGIVYFSQPIEMNNEQDIISAIYKYCLNNGIPFYIKIHPRQNKDDFIGYKIFGSEVSFDDIARNYALVVTRSSSIGLDCFSYGIPVLFARTIPSIKNARISFIPDGYFGDVSTITEMVNVIENFDDLVCSFLNHSRQSLDNDLNDNIEKILS